MYLELFLIFDMICYLLSAFVSILFLNLLHCLYDIFVRMIPLQVSLFIFYCSCRWIWWSTSVYWVSCFWNIHQIGGFGRSPWLITTVHHSCPSGPAWMTLTACFLVAILTILGIHPGDTPPGCGEVIFVTYYYYSIALLQLFCRLSTTSNAMPSRTF